MNKNKFSVQDIYRICCILHLETLQSLRYCNIKLFLEALQMAINSSVEIEFSKLSLTVEQSSKLIEFANVNICKT